MTDTWSWTDIGMASNIKVVEQGVKITHPYGKGYRSSRSGTSRILKDFVLIYDAATNAQWLKLVEFWRSQFGTAFYWEYPVEIYGAGGYGGYAGIVPDDGFTAVIDTGAGGGPSFLVEFEGDSLPQRYQSDLPGHWTYEFTLLEVS